MSWLDDIVKVHSEFEAPKSFYYWSALTAISAVVKDNIWIDRYIYKLYPNIYTMLHAESGMKKGPAISMARQLVKNSIGDSHIISGRSSIQAILKEMGGASTIPGGKVIQNNATFICSSELSSSIIDDPISTTILTDLYDRQYNEMQWKSLLKSDIFTIKNPTVSMLTGTNDAMASDFFAQSAIRGGFFARTFIIHESKRNRTNSLLVPPEFKIDYFEASKYLKELIGLKGPFLPLGSRTCTETHRFGMKDASTGDTYYYSKAGIAYEEWYAQFTQMIDDQEVKDDTGTLNRFGDSVLKVAMLMSLSKSPKLEIDENTINEAIEKCEKLIGNTKKVTIGKNGTSQSSALKSLIILELLNREPHSISKQLLMKKYWMHYNGEDEFNDTMGSMHESKMIMTTNMGNTVIYHMPDKQVDEMKRLMSGKMK